ncbi:PIN domain-containing protein (plasmid) [Ralstonia syzygii]|uniref:PIN domain-containing protein n=1 Tax=Ralstonia syzygii TaxID=28097 RepID=A0ABX7ZNQ6_9RALS|nr:PIN domain-containing protein [Ralstonia syzygii]QUP56891.1 PIN domain-containing protein [Ralstonia syzygii]
MNLKDTFVVLDTCVLLMQRVSDVLMDLRAEKLFSAHWTENIDNEFLRNLQKVYDIPLEKAQNRLRAMKARCPEWEVPMSVVDFARVPESVDQKDRHIAAAALALRHAVDKDAEEDEPGQTYHIILVSENIKDMAKKPMAKLGVRVMRVGEFLNEVYRAEPEAAKRAVCQAAKDLKKPPYTVPELLDVLRQAGAKTLASQLSKDLGVAPVQKEKPSKT